MQNLPSRFFDRKTRIGYVGWIGQGNLGDEVMFEAARKFAGSHLGTVGSLRAEWILNALATGGSSRFPFVLLGGGTLISGGYLSIVEAMLHCGSRLATLGTGAGSSGFREEDTPIDERWVRALNRFERVGIRGPQSLSKLRSAGVRHAEVIGDLAMALTPAKPIADWQARRVLVNAAVGRSDADKANLCEVNRAMAKLLRDLSRSGWQVIPVAFHASDGHALAEILRAADLASTKVALPRNFVEYARLAGQSSISIGVRLHSSVLASACGLPNILFNYRDKCLDFAASVDAEQTLVPLAGFDEAMLMDAFGKISSDPAKEGRSIHEACLSYRNLICAYVQSLM